MLTFGIFIPMVYVGMNTPHGSSSISYLFKLCTMMMVYNQSQFCLVRVTTV